MMCHVHCTASHGPCNAARPMNRHTCRKNSQPETPAERTANQAHRYLQKEQPTRHTCRKNSQPEQDPYAQTEPRNTQSKLGSLENSQPTQNPYAQTKLRNPKTSPAHRPLPKQGPKPESQVGDCRRQGCEALREKNQALPTNPRPVAVAQR